MSVAARRASKLDEGKSTVANLSILLKNTAKMAGEFSSVYAKTI